MLWIHDYRGVNAEGDPDLLALAHTANYLEAMTQRVLEYDDTGKSPSYQILIDQHFFEVNDGRRFLRVLERPLEYEPGLPDEYEYWETRIADGQRRLREAVDASALLQLERSQYGEEWPRNYIKVHVNITNQADPSFFSMQIAGIIPVPDNNMRDHRKIAFYDVTEEDPFRGLAMFTGMGIGEHYAGANWEDRAVMVQGPAALEVKNAARHLLEIQGFEPEQIPWALRPVRMPASYQARIDSVVAATTPDWLGSRGRVLQLHSDTGFFEKPVEVAKLSAHDLMSRVVAFANGLETEIDDVGSVLAVGLYAPKQDVGDLGGRFRQATDTRAWWAPKVVPGRGATLRSSPTRSIRFSPRSVTRIRTRRTPRAPTRSPNSTSRRTSSRAQWGGTS